MLNILEIDSVILEFKSKIILNNVYLKSETGKTTGILGRNGSGKSSIMKIIYGEIRPNEKSLRINKIPILKTHHSSKDIKYLPQNNFIPKQLTLKRVFNDFKLNYLDFIIFFPEFEKYYTSKLKNLSGGERRVIEIYATLVSKTNFILLDEPFSHVMPYHIKTLKDLILREKKNKGIIITDHLYKHVVEISDTLYILNNKKTYLVNNIKDLETHGYIRGQK